MGEAVRLAAIDLHIFKFILPKVARNLIVLSLPLAACPSWRVCGRSFFPRSLKNMYDEPGCGGKKRWEDTTTTNPGLQSVQQSPLYWNCFWFKSLLREIDEAYS